MSDKQSRRYSEREIGAILKRATELQDDRERATGLTPEGLTLDEIEQIAHEVGVDADLVRRAATEMAHTGTPEKRWYFLGGPIKTKEHALVPTHPTDEDLDEMVVAIRQHLGQKGSFEKLNGVLTWTAQEHGSQDEVSIVPEGEQTRIQGRQFFFGIAMLFFFLPLFLTLVIGSAYLAEEVGLPMLLEMALLIGALLTIFGLGRGGFKWWTRQQRRKMATLVQHLGEMVEASSVPALATEEEQMQVKLEVPEAGPQGVPERTPRRSSTR
jgi:hypothetical protein